MLTKVDSFYTMLFCIVVNCWMGETALFSGAYSILKYVFLGVAFLFWSIEIKKIRLKKLTLVFCFLCLLMAAYNYVNTQNSWILYSTMIIISSLKKDVRNVVSFIRRLMWALFLCNLTIWIFQYIFSPGSLIIVASGAQNRYSLGFASPNEGARFWLYLFFLDFYVKKRLSMTWWVGMSLGSLIVYRLTDSDALVFAVILLVGNLVKNVNVCRVIVCKYSRYVFLLFSVGTYYFVTHYNAVSRFLDMYAFTGRLNLARKALDLYGFTYFGQRVDFFIELHDATGWSFLVVDNAYAYMMVASGVVFLVLVILLTLLYDGTNRYKECLCILFYAVFALAENNIFNPTAIFPLLIVVDSVVKNKMVKKGGYLT